MLHKYVVFSTSKHTDFTEHLPDWEWRFEGGYTEKRAAIEKAEELQTARAGKRGTVFVLQTMGGWEHGNTMMDGNVRHVYSSD